MVELSCPVCGEGVGLVEDGPGQRACGKCRGTWVSPATLASVLRNAAPHADPPLGLGAITAHELPEHIAARHRRGCPDCKATMISGTLFAVLVDRCAEHGVWVDAGELSRIVLAARRADRR